MSEKRAAFAAAEAAKLRVSEKIVRLVVDDWEASKRRPSRPKAAAKPKTTAKGK